MVWELKKLEEVCEELFAGGDVPKNNISKIKTDEFSIPIFSNGIKNKGLYGYTNIKKVTKPSVTISARGTIGYSEVRNKEFFPVVRLIVLTPNTNLIDIYYLNYAISRLNFSNSGVAIPQLTVPMVKKYEIPIPPLPIQKQIVSILDEAFEKLLKAKENAERNLLNAKEIFESYLQRVFENKGEEWEEKTLGEICDVISGQSPEGKFYNKIGEGLPFYQGKKEFTEKYIGEPTTWTTKITKEAEANNILMSVRAPVGPINISTQKICIGRGLAAIRAGKLIEKEFLFNFLLKHEKEIISNTGAVFNSINRTQIKNIKLPLPSIKEQNEIVNNIELLLNETKKLKSNYNKKLANLEELKQSILQKAFNGELTT